MRHIKSQKHLRMVTSETQKVTESDTGFEHVTQMLPQITLMLPSKSGQSKNDQSRNESCSNHICDLCKRSYKHRSGLSRHRKKCLEGSDAAKDKTIQELRNQMDEYRSLLKSSNDLTKQSMNIAQTNAATANTATKKSLSAINYLVKFHPNAPVIKPLGHREVKLLDMREDNLLETLDYHDRKKTLHKFIGDFIVTVYKEDDVKLQSVWVSDSSRLTYIVRKLLNNEPKWVVDKTGRILLTSVIEPFLAHLRGHINSTATEPVKADYPHKMDYYKAIKVYGGRGRTRRRDDGG